MNLIFNLQKNLHPTSTLMPSEWYWNVTIFWGKENRQEKKGNPNSVASSKRHVWKHNLNNNVLSEWNISKDNQNSQK